MTGRQRTWLSGRYHEQDMSSLWSELEQVLDEVQKPARYIGGEDGMIVPAHRPDKVGWLLIYPDT